MKTKTHANKLWLAAAAIVFTMTLLLKPVDVKAALAAPANLRQTDAYTSTSKVSFEVEWNELSEARKYGITYSEDKVHWADEYITYSTSKTYSSSDNGIAKGKTYYVKVCAYDGSNVQGAWSSIIEVNTAPGASASISQTNAAKNAITMNYAASEGATGYSVYYGISSSFDPNSLTFAGDVSATSITISNLPTNAGYYVYVIPFRKSANASYKAYSNYTTKTTAFTIPTKPTSVKPYARSYNKKLTYLKWTITDAYADGYEIQICNEKGKKLASTKVTYTSYKYNGYGEIKTSKAFNTPFQYRVRAYKVVNNKTYYSDWTSYQKYIPGAVCKSPIKHTRTSGKLKWYKVKGATSYTVYWASANSPTGKLKWKAVAKNVKGTSATVKYSSSKLYNFYYVKANKVKFGKKKYNSASPKSALDVYYTY